MRTEVQTAQAGYVIRAEFEAWRTGIGREIGDIKASIVRVETAVDNAQRSAEARRPSWPAVLAACVAVASTALTIVLNLR